MKNNKKGLFYGHYGAKIYLFWPFLAQHTLESPVFPQISKIRAVTPEVWSIMVVNIPDNKMNKCFLLPLWH